MRINPVSIGLARVLDNDIEAGGYMVKHQSFEKQVNSWFYTKGWIHPSERVLPEQWIWGHEERHVWEALSSLVYLYWNCSCTGAWFGLVYHGIEVEMGEIIRFQYDLHTFILLFKTCLIISKYFAHPYFAINIFFYWLYTHTQLKSLQGSLKFSKKHYTKCKQSFLEMTLVLFIYSLWILVV